MYHYLFVVPNTQQGVKYLYNNILASWRPLTSITWDYIGQICNHPPFPSNFCSSFSPLIYSPPPLAKSLTVYCLRCHWPDEKTWISSVIRRWHGQGQPSILISEFLCDNKRGDYIEAICSYRSSSIYTLAFLHVHVHASPYFIFKGKERKKEGAGNNS